LFFGPAAVFAIHSDHNKYKNQDKENGENNLSGAEHIFYFSAKLTQTASNMKENIKAVAEFHRAFGLGISTELIADLGSRKNTLRFKLMEEENQEYFQAAQQGDMVEVADALGDMLYILCGTILEHGMQEKIEEVFREIQRSNMSKLGADGRPVYREDGKVLKGPDYFQPNLATILETE
jgi:predicted HAD superfamily Cof-like phosphohydrolase